MIRNIIKICGGCALVSIRQRFILCDQHKQENTNAKYDILVVGGGVVGLSVARECAEKYNCSVLILEKEDSIVAGIPPALALLK